MSLRRLRMRRPHALPPNDVRQPRLAVIRFVYCSLTLLLALWLGDVFVGSLFYLRSQGQVIGELVVVAVEFPATVRDLAVQEGDWVAKGQVVAIIASQNVAERLSRLSAEQADRVLRLGEARIRAETVNAVIDLARTRRDIAVRTRHKLEALLPTGFLPLDRRIAALDGEFRSREDLARLTAEQDASTTQIVELSQAVTEARIATEALRRLYDGGVLRAPIAGIVGRRMAEAGTVLGPGQPLLELYNDARFVRAFLPTGSLFAPSLGDRVVIRTGLQNLAGSITRIEPIAAALPPEFQRVFTPLDRQQMIRIDFDPGQLPPPLFTKVSIRSDIPGHWRIGLAGAFGR
jgi:multidrug efflux pump subunit AcrA (membrane-fusion protein)